MLEQLISHERQNFRPIVLGLCFLCGLIFGFIFYIATPSFARKQAESEAQARIIEAEQRSTRKVGEEPVQTVPSIVGLDRTKSDEPLVLEVDPSKTVIEDDPATKGDMRKMPEPLAVAMSFDTGLSGRTTYRPLKPVKVNKPAPEVDFNTRAVSPTPIAGKVGEAELPELDD